VTGPSLRRIILLSFLQTKLQGPLFLFQSFIQRAWIPFGVSTVLCIRGAPGMPSSLAEVSQVTCCSRDCRSADLNWRAAFLELRFAVNLLDAVFQVGCIAGVIITPIWSVSRKLPLHSAWYRMCVEQKTRIASAVSETLTILAQNAC